MVDLVQAHPSGGYILDELHVGMAAEKTVHVTEERIRLFAEASDDFNPVHLDEAFAAKTAYRGRIAHGLLSAAFGSAVVGTILPGAGSIYISQTLAFHFPVRIGDTVRIGEARFVLRGTVASEPDKVASAFQFGPRAIIPLAAIPATQLVQPGSLVTYAYRLRLPPAFGLYPCRCGNIVPDADPAGRTHQHAAQHPCRICRRRRRRGYGLRPAAYAGGRPAGCLRTPHGAQSANHPDG